MKNYLLEKLARIEPQNGYDVRAIFVDGFQAEIDLAPLLERGPLYASWRDPAAFRALTVSRHGVPEWRDNLDLSPAALRSWCEAGRVLSPEETDAWIEQRSELAEPELTREPLRAG